MVLRVKFGWKCVRSAGVAAGLVWVCFLAVSVVNAQAVSSPQESTANFRLLTSEEGRAIVNAAWEQNQPAGGSEDCSHVVHEIYVKAGFEYAYASSFDIYAGNENFIRRTGLPGTLLEIAGKAAILSLQGGRLEKRDGCQGGATCPNAKERGTARWSTCHRKTFRCGVFRS